jgi:ATP-dependent DNA helicase RecG
VKEDELTGILELSAEDIRRLNQMLSKREEIQRIFGNAGLLQADELPAQSMNLDDLDYNYFNAFLKKHYGKSVEEREAPLEQLLRNMNLMKDDHLTITGGLLFGKLQEFKLPLSTVRAIAFPGEEIDMEKYLDSRSISGNMESIFHETVNFIGASIRHVQAGQPLNSLGVWEIPRQPIEELVCNALIHRDLLVSGFIRVFVFSNRIEIISPGHLPNSLTIDNIKNGASTMRNQILATFATKILPYSGLGMGIPNALQEYPAIDFVDDREANQFTAIIQRQA